MVFWLSLSICCGSFDSVALMTSSTEPQKFLLSMGDLFSSTLLNTREMFVCDSDVYD